VLDFKVCIWTSRKRITLVKTDVNDCHSVSVWCLGKMQDRIPLQGQQQLPSTRVTLFSPSPLNILLPHAQPCSCCNKYYSSSTTNSIVHPLTGIIFQYRSDFCCKSRIPPQGIALNHFKDCTTVIAHLWK